MKRIGALVLVIAVIVTACGSEKSLRSPASTTPTTALNIYAKAGVDMFTDVTKSVPYRLYVPNSEETSMMVIDPATQTVLDTIPVGRNPNHVVPSWDLKTLYVTNTASNSLTPIDPMTSKVAGPDIPVDDPYNMYFTPDGTHAIVVAEALQRLDFRDPHTFALQNSVPVECSGVDHIDFAADHSYLIATCEFSGRLVKVSLPDQKVVGYLDLKPGAIPQGTPQPQEMVAAMAAGVPMPQDIKVDPQGKIFYVADMMNDGVWKIDGDSFKNLGLVHTGPEAHGLYPSRDAKHLYVSNRGGLGVNAGSVSVIDFATQKVVETWSIPAPSTPDMGGVSADGRVLWLAGRRTNEIYGIDTADGHLVARVKVGKGPHGMAVWPQPGTYSLGHTGILR